MQILKYRLPVSDRQVVSLPLGAKILSVQIQRGHPQLWAFGDETAGRSDRVIRMYGTGQDTPNDPGVFIDTIQLNDGYLVFHVFEGAA